MRKTIIFILVILALVSGLALLDIIKIGKISPKQFKPPSIEKNGQEPVPEDKYAGEKIIYEIRLGSVYIGKAEFNHLHRVELGGRQVNFVTFSTKIVRFTDLEKIYSDPQTFLPLKIERDVSTWPIPEKITEDYDQQKFVLAIKKIKGNKTQKMIIKKEGSIHNAILLPYHVRRIPELNIGWVFKARLPTREFEIKLVSIEVIKIPGGIFKAYHFESSPKRFEIWISADERRIPLKIKGVDGLGYTFLMKEHKL